MAELIIIFGLAFGFFGIVGLIEKLPFVDKMLEKILRD